MTTTPTIWLDSFFALDGLPGAPPEHEIVGLSNGNFAVVFTSFDRSDPDATRDISGLIFDALGNVMVPEFEISGSSLIEGNPSVAATNDGGFVVASEAISIASGSSDIGYQVIRVNDQGAPFLSRFFSDTVGLFPSFEETSVPALTVDPTDNSVFLAYTLRVSSGGDFDEPLRGIAFSDELLPAPGTPFLGHLIRGDESPQIITGPGAPLVATLSDGDYVSAFTETDLDLGIEFAISDGTTGATTSSVNNIGNTGSNGAADILDGLAALEDDGFVVLWRQFSASEAKLVFARFNDSGGQEGQITAVLVDADGLNDPRIIALKDGGFFIAWHDQTPDVIRGTRFDANGVRIGTNGFILETDVNSSSLADVNLELGLTSDGRILVSWADQFRKMQVQIWDPRDTTIFADPGDAQITARRLEDTTLIGSSDSETLFGFEGDDLIDSGGGLDLIYGGDGDDTVVARADAAASPNEVFGDSGNDVIGIEGASFGSNVDGGEGIDTFDLGAFDFDGYEINLEGEFSKELSLPDVFALVRIENVVGTIRDDIVNGDDEANTLAGRAGADSISGGEGADSISGGDGNDTIDGGDGDDNLNGGEGTDTISFASLSEPVFIVDGFERGVFVNLGEALFPQNTGMGSDRIVDFENIEGSVFGDLLLGDDKANTILGQGGHDALEGGPGADLLDGGAGVDSADYLFSSEAVVVAVDGSFAIGGDAEGDTLIDIENLLGSAFADFLRGDGQANVLTGGAGADYIQGRGGNDILNGGESDDLLEPGAGADTVDGGAGQDLLSALDAVGPVTIDLADSGNSTGDFAGDTLISIEGILGAGAFSNTITGTAADDLFIGGNEADVLTGNGGENVLLGQGGDDLIVGGADADVLLTGFGDDTVTSGTGADRILFALNEADGEGQDLITDFEIGQDLIIFYGTGFAAENVSVGTAAGSTNALLSYANSSVELDGITEADVSANFVFIEA